MFATEERTPFTSVVSEFPVDVATLDVMMLEVAVTPLVLLVSVLPVAERVLLDITELVAVTPLMVVVSVFPASDCEKLLMMFVSADVIPFTTVWMVLVVVASVFDVTALEVATIPFTVEVMVLPAVARVFDVELASPEAIAD